MSWEGLVMTLNKSLFNFGIFKNTIYRFKWGSLLYFVALFFTVPFMLLVADFDRLVERVIGSSYYMPASIILRSDYLTMPLILAVAVPTVVAVLVFNNVHSAKQGIFTHGLPCDRQANYISNLAASFVLMGVPVLLNATILMIMSCGKYGQVISSMSVIYWSGLNLNMLFVMFSVAVFASFLTGNIAAHIGINVLLHLVPMIIAWAIYLISDKFLYGFYQADNFIANELINNSPIIWIFGRSLSLADKLNEMTMPLFAKLQTWIYIIGAIGVYVLGYLLYKNRKIEACGDVAAFKSFKPILKYAVVTCAAIALFGILTSIEMNAVAMFVVVLVLCAITYFAAEMLINKSFKIFKASYKGYLGFVICCAVFIGFFAYINVFGYETRVPKLEDIKSALAQEGWNSQNIVSDDPQLIAATLKMHKELIADIPVVVEMNDTRTLLVSYELKNGKTMQRRYHVNGEMFNRVMDEMYKSKAYKLQVTGIDNLNIENVDNLSLNVNSSTFSYHIAMNDETTEFLNAIKKDIEEISYMDYAEYDSVLGMRVEVSCSVEENERFKYFKETGYKLGTEEAKYAIETFDIAINPNFKNAYAFLKEKGYYDEVMNRLGQTLVICKKPVYRAGEVYTYKGMTGSLGEFLISYNDCADIDAADERQLAQILAERSQRNTQEGKSYLVFVGNRDLGDEIRAIERVIVLAEDQLPDYLRKYVEE